MYKNKKSTKTILEIQKIFEDSDQPITAKDIINSLSQQNVSVWPSTVYRILDRLVGSGIIDKITMINDNTIYYQISHNEHLHIAYCLGCNKREKIHICPIPKLKDDVLKSTGFKVTDHKMELYGYCNDCKNNHK